MESDTMTTILRLTMALCDPMEQPSDNDTQILSLDFLADVYILLSYHVVAQRPEVKQVLETTVQNIKFTLSTYFMRIYFAIQKSLQAYDEHKLATIDNSEDKWWDNMYMWMPPMGMEPRLLKTIYAMSCLLLIATYKLFAPEHYPSEAYELVKNPWLVAFIRSWKCHTSIILLALEIDRRIEQQNEEEDTDENQTPEILFNALEGSSAIRCVLAWILNQEPTTFVPDTNIDLTRIHEVDPHLTDSSIDITGVSLLDFVRPTSRHRVDGGALRTDLRLLVIAQAILRSCSTVTLTSAPLEKPDNPKSHSKAQQDSILATADLLVDLEYDDRFDEDIRYVFDYELEGSDDEFSDARSNGEELLGESEASNEEVAIGENSQYTDEYQAKVNNNQTANEGDTPSFLLSDIMTLGANLKFFTVGNPASKDNSDRKWGQKLLDSIAYAKIAPQSSQFHYFPSIILGYLMLPASIEDIEECRQKNMFLLPIATITYFELLLKSNTQLTRSICDELMMFSDTREKLLLCLAYQQNLNPLMIDYAYELVSGLRGRPEHSAYKFSRKGGRVILTEDEVNNFLHGFFLRSMDYFYAVEGIPDDSDNKVVLPETVAKKNMLLVCLMMDRLISQGVISLDTNAPNCFNGPLRLLLVAWIGKVKEARELFFRINSAMYDLSKDDIRGQAGPSEPDDEKLEEPRYGVSDNVMKQMAGFKTTSEMIAVSSLKPHILAPFAAYARRLQTYMPVLFSRTQPPTLETAPEIVGDLRFFFNNMNQLANVSVFVSSLFEAYDSNTRPEKSAEDSTENICDLESHKKKKKKKKSKKKK